LESSLLPQKYFVLQSYGMEPEFQELRPFFLIVTIILVF
jgi:hypothetical protein